MASKQQPKFYSVTLLLQARPGLEEADIAEELCGKSVAKNYIVDVSSVDLVDEEELDSIDSDKDDGDASEASSSSGTYAEED